MSKPPVQNAAQPPRRSDAHEKPSMPPAALFGTSHSFGGGDGPLPEQQVRARIYGIVRSDFPNRRGKLKLFEDGVIGALGGWYQLAGRTDAAGREVRAILYASHLENLAPSSPLPPAPRKKNYPKPVASENVALVYAGHKKAGSWRWLLTAIDNHTDEVISAVADNNLHRTAIGVYQGAAVSYRLQPLGDDAVRVQLYSNHVKDPDFEPVDGKGRSMLARLAARPYDLGAVKYEEAERLIAADFARRQARTARGDDPLTLPERLRNPRQLASRLLRAGDQELNRHSWRNPREWMVYGGHLGIMAAKFAVSGVANFADMAVDWAKNALDLIPDEDKTPYMLPMNRLTKELGCSAKSSSLMNSVLRPLRLGAIGDYRLLDFHESGLAEDGRVRDAKPPRIRQGAIDYLLNPMAVPGSLVKYWNGATRNCITLQQPDGLRIDYVLNAGGEVSDLYARCVDGWQVRPLGRNDAYQPCLVPDSVRAEFMRTDNGATTEFPVVHLQAGLPGQPHQKNFLTLEEYRARIDRVRPHGEAPGASTGPAPAGARPTRTFPRPRRAANPLPPELKPGQPGYGA